ncbi:MAG: ABC transporter permease [Verrucomicrobiia bacterium]
MNRKPTFNLGLLPNGLDRLLTVRPPADFARTLLSQIGLPLLALAIFLGLWSHFLAGLDVGFATMPGPSDVWKAAAGLYQDHRAEREREAQFYQRQAERRERFLAENPGQTFPERRYSGRPTYFDQIGTSLRTVFTGFLIASCIAVPLGILCGLSRAVNTALNPFIQIFRPVSPLAWLPIVMILVGSLYNPPDPLFTKAFLTSAITVALCCLWPTLINTAVGVASIDTDYLNVARVLRLSWPAKIFKIVLPAALPYIFTGLRLSLGVGWMVLIAAEMLAQNPGLGKFVWDMFQNGSSQSLSLIMVAIFTIGVIGFALDRLMLALQTLVTFEPNQR